MSNMLSTAMAEMKWMVRATLAAYELLIDRLAKQYGVDEATCHQAARVFMGDASPAQVQAATGIEGELLWELHLAANYDHPALEHGPRLRSPEEGDTRRRVTPPSAEERSWLAAYADGADGRDFPDGAGMILHAAQWVVLGAQGDEDRLSPAGRQALADMTYPD